jgi:hypothetical protein
MHPTLTIALAAQIQRDLRTRAHNFPSTRTTRRTRPPKTL